MSVWMFRRYYEEQEREIPIPAPVVEDKAVDPEKVEPTEKKAEPKRQKKTTKK